MSQPTLTIAYITNRRDCRIEWFWQSLKRQLGDRQVRVIIVDFFKEERETYNPKTQSPTIWKEIQSLAKHVMVKPNVWCGPHRLCKENYFSAATFRNSAILHCETTHLAFCDDISVLTKGWLDFVFQAITQDRIYLGAYKKVKHLTVVDGAVVAFDEFPAGIDSRWSFGRDDQAMPCTGDYLYGCSFVAPLEALLSVNGLDENCDSCGGEDYCLGIRLYNRGYQFSYARQMLTLESEELHHAEKPFIRLDKGISPNDRSHALLKMARESNYAPNFFPEGGIRELRDRILAGEDFPQNPNPQHDFFDGQPISEM